MRPVKTITVMGAGAVGGYFGARLAERHGLEIPVTRTIYRFYRLLEVAE